METTLKSTVQNTARNPSTSILKGLGWGAIGGIAGTLAMDLTLMALLTAIGSPTLTCFSIVGDTVAHFFSMQETGMTGAILLGVATHYTVGPVIGAIFGLLAARVKALRVITLKKSLLLGILYVEILSQPLLATTPILLKMSADATLQWYGGSFLMHMIAGAVMGAVVDRGLRLAGPGNPEEATIKVLAVFSNPDPGSAWHDTSRVHCDVSVKESQESGQGTL